jgi:hypothetical protein
MQFRWALWVIVSLILAAYVAAGYLSSRSDTISIKLEPGFSTEVRVFRLARQNLEAKLLFRGDHLDRPELGNSVSIQSGALRQYANPGAAILLTVSKDGERISLEAMPKSAHGDGLIIRNLTINRSTRAGAWRWPPPSEGPQLVLQPGMNPVRITVISVAPPLLGEAVDLTIAPPLGFKATESNVAWLWFWFFWPIMAAVQLLWAAVLGMIAWRQSR